MKEPEKLDPWKKTEPWYAGSVVSVNRAPSKRQFRKVTFWLAPANSTVLSARARLGLKLDALDQHVVAPR